MPDCTYRGRFAPSPTGPLHLGSLIAALASYLDARAAGGHWLLRMEDLDPPREEAGAADSILTSLEQHGLNWDGSVLYQSTRHEAYRAALEELQKDQCLFRCYCTRAQLGPDGACAGRCTHRQEDADTPYALRVRVPGQCTIAFDDQLQGPQYFPLGANTADFVVHRKDGLHAYQLAVVVDDAHQGITQVVRGSDLLDSTPRQIFLQTLLGLFHPDYCHLPVITSRNGKKFSKQNFAPPLADERAADNLRLALAFLVQRTPPEDYQRPEDILDFASLNWSPATIPATLAVPAAQLGLDA